MNTSKVLEKLYQFKSFQSRDVQEKIDRISSASMKEIPLMDYEHLVASLIQDCKAALLEEQAKACGKNEQKKAAERILEQNNSMFAPFMQEENQVIHGVYSAVMLKNKLPLNEEAGRQASADQAQYIISLFENYSENSIEVTVPSVKEIKALIKENKANKIKCPAYKDIEEGYAVDLSLLLDVMILLGDDSKCFIGEHKKTMVYLKNENGDQAILCLVRKGNK